MMRVTASKNLGLCVGTRRRNKKLYQTLSWRLTYLYGQENRFLVVFATKITKQYYVGIITSVSEEHHTVKSARRVKNTSTFVWPQTDDISEVETDCCNIPPTACGG
jgi:hypothetical protein